MAATTVTVSNTSPQRIIDLIRAVSGYANTKVICAILTVRADDGNAANALYLGDSNVSSTNYGIKLLAGDSRTYPSAGQGNTVDLSNKYLLASAVSTKADLNWEIF